MTQDNSQPDHGTNGHSNHGRHDLEKRNDLPPLRRSAIRALVQDFGPLWFTWCMNSGVLAILTHQCPYQFHGLKIISDIFFILDLTLFTLFSLIFIARFAIFRRQAYNEITGSQADLMLVACWPIAFMTLTSLTSLIVSNATWGGHAFTIVAYVMWWFVVAWNLCVLFWVFGTLISQHEASDRRLPMMVIIPAVSVSTIAVTGGFVASMSFGISARMAVPVIVVSFMMVGMGILLGLMLSTYLFHALLAQGWPDPGQSASLFIFVGPMGQSAAALQALGRAASMGAFGAYNKGTFLTAEAAVPLEAACMLIALMLTGLGFIWTVLSIMAMVTRAVKKELSWSPGWNAIIFPMGTLVTATSLFSEEMDSPAFRVITAGLIIILVAVFLINTVFTAKGIWKGQLLIVREDPRVKKRMEEEQKGR